MTSPLTPEDALARVPGWSASLECRPLTGGLTNRSFIVRAEDRDFVLRLDAADTSVPGLDRNVELRVLRQAASAGLAPSVHFADPVDGILVVEHLAGPVWERRHLEDPDNLERLGGLLRAVHGLPKAGTALDINAAAERYYTLAARDPALRAHAARCLQIVREAGGARPVEGELCCCHNDVIAANIIGSQSLKLLDWEYACDNDPFFDLASLIAYHDLGCRQAASLREAYTGSSDREAEERLEIQLRLFDSLQWLWLAARGVLAPDHANRARLQELEHRTR